MRVKRSRARPYDHEFKAECVSLMQGDERSYQQLGKDLGVNPETLRGWYNKDVARKNIGKRPPKPRKHETPEQKLERLERENAHLERENASLKMDREILKKAAAYSTGQGNTLFRDLLKVAAGDDDKATRADES